MRDHWASFRMAWILLAAAAAGIASGCGSALTLRVGYRIDFQVPASLLLPLAFVCIAGGVVIDPVGPSAATTVRPLRRLLAGRVGSCLLAFMAGLAIGGELVKAPDGSFAVSLRSAVVLLGLTLGTTAVVSAALSWIPASAFAIACMVAGARQDGSRKIWAVLLERSVDDRVAWIVAAGSVFAGAAVVAARLRCIQAR